MKASLLYRIASILLLLFAVGHTLGFRRVDPKWGIDSLISSMRSIRFNANGFERSYWDFFVGFGLFVSVLMAMRVSAWGFVVCFAAVAYLSWRYFFTVPVVFSIVILLCLAVAAWISGKPS